MALLESYWPGHFAPRLRASYGPGAGELALLELARECWHRTPGLAVPVFVEADLLGALDRDYLRIACRILSRLAETAQVFLLLSPNLAHDVSEQLVPDRVIPLES